MKNLLITLALVSSLLVGSTAFAQTADEAKLTKIETVVVVAQPEVANFEIYSLELADQAMKSMMDAVADTLSSPLISVSNKVNEVAASLSSSI